MPKRRGRHGPIRARAPFFVRPHSSRDHDLIVSSGKGPLHIPQSQMLKYLPMVHAWFKKNKDHVGDPLNCFGTERMQQEDEDIYEDVLEWVNSLMCPDKYPASRQNYTGRGPAGNELADNVSAMVMAIVHNDRETFFDQCNYLLVFFDTLTSMHGPGRFKITDTLLRHLLPLATRIISSITDLSPKAAYSIIRCVYEMTLRSKTSLEIMLSVVSFRALQDLKNVARSGYYTRNSELSSEIMNFFP